MAILALHCPPKVLSLSPSALDRQEGIWHYVASFHGPAQNRDFEDIDHMFAKDTVSAWPSRKVDDPDAMSVTTVCGKLISAYPETPQKLTRPCVRCINTPQPPETHWVRLLPPIIDSEIKDRWARYYWRDHGGMFSL